MIFQRSFESRFRVSIVPEPPGINLTPAWVSVIMSSNECFPVKKSEIVFSVFTPISILALDKPKSASRIPTVPFVMASFIAEFTASEVFPTPPFPLTNAIVSVIRLPALIIN